MVTFIAVYRGAKVGEAQLVAVSTNHELVADVSARLLRETHTRDPDPVIEKLEKGRRSALRLVRRQASKS